jgi:hypothetical protein
MGMMRGKFMVKDDEYPAFIDLLHEYLFTQLRRPLNLVEQRRCDGMAPLLIDLDFKYPAERAIQRQFELSHIYTFLQQYVENITHFYDLTEYKPLRFFITLRPSPYEDKKAANRSIKDGVHIQCPDIILNSEHQQVLRNRSIEFCNLTNAFKDTGYINSEKDIFDEAIVKKNGWFFYGESKPDIPAYHLESVYVYNGAFSEEKNQYTPRQLMELLSIRYNLAYETIECIPETQDEWKSRLDFCTGNYAGKRISHIEEPKEVIVVTSSNVYEQLEKDKIATAKLLALECLSAERASGYQSWIEVGWCLHNIDPSEEMFYTFMEFSDKSPKSGQNNVAMLLRDWNRGWSKREKQFTIRSLHMWAKQDNIVRYREIMKNSFVEFVEREVDATHTHIARLMKRMYENNYCAAVDSKKVEWFHFNGICWKKLPQGIELRNKLTGEVTKVIIDTRSKICERIMGINDEQKVSWEKGRLKSLLNVERSLYQSGFKDAVMKDCIGLFYEEEFTNKLNSNEYLIGEIHCNHEIHLKTVSRFTTNPLKSITGITNKGDIIF